MSTPKVHSASSWIRRTAPEGGAGEAPALPRVRVQFCGSWGYAPRYREVQQQLVKVFPGLEVAGDEDEGTTGNFEIFVGAELVHSRQNGDGFVDSPAKVQTLVRAVRSAKAKSAPAVVVAVGGAGAGALEGRAEAGAEAEAEAEARADADAGNNRSFCVSVLTLVLSIPALIGAWCWPALLIGLVSGTVTSSARTLGHWLSFFITLTMMIILNIFMYRALKYRYVPLDGGNGCLGRGCKKYGPFMLTMLAAPLIMADLTRHVMGDTGFWPWCGDPAQQGGYFPRVNESWTDACFWSSTEYVCNIPCCVPGDNTVQGANDLDLNYFLEVNKTAGTVTQRSFTDNCGVNATGYNVPLAEATHTDPRCYCGMAKCDPTRPPIGQMSTLEVGDPTMGLLERLPEGADQDTNYPTGFGPGSAASAFPPHWPAYPQLDGETLQYVKAQAMLGTKAPPDTVPDCNCDNCVPPDQENIHHLSFIGVLFTIIFTYTGFVLLAVGTMWNADIVKKVKDICERWKQLRGRTNSSKVSSVDDDGNLGVPLLKGDQESKLAAHL